MDEFSRRGDSEQDSYVVDGDFGGHPSSDTIDSADPCGQWPEAAAEATECAEDAFDLGAEPVHPPRQLGSIAPEFHGLASRGRGVEQRLLGASIAFLRREQEPAASSHLGGWRGHVFLDMQRWMARESWKT